jgi:hypothetical protein
MKPHPQGGLCGTEAAGGDTVLHWPFLCLS